MAVEKMVVPNNLMRSDGTVQSVDRRVGSSDWHVSRTCWEHTWGVQCVCFYLESYAAEEDDGWAMNDDDVCN